jgi:carboxylesterase type B
MISRTITSLLLFIIVLVSTVQSLQSVIETEQEFIISQYTNDSKVIRYLGIPYAQSPIGLFRWKPTQSLPVLPASGKPHIERMKYGKSCSQLPQEPFDELAKDSSEDCLSLNIWKPNVNISDTNPLSVMVYIHGGKYRYGGSSVYDGEYMVTKSIDLGFPVIVVTINYRLGVFGFLAHDELYKEDSTTGNYGILDQITALNWIKSNIHQFGGDPNRVTIFGDSAGGKSVAIHMVSKRTITSNLFHRAIIMSGIFEPSVQLTLKEANQIGTKIQQSVNCVNVTSVTECLRAQPVDKLLKSLGPNQIDNWLPVIDNYVLTEPIEDSFKNQRYKNIPVVIGSTSDERGEYICKKYGDIKLYKDLVLILNYELPSNINAKEVLAFYNVTENQSNYTQALIQIKSDYSNHCPTRSVALELSKQIYYTFLYTYSWRLGYLPQCQGATHSSDVVPLFPSVLKYVAPDYQFAQFEQYLSNDMTRYWMYFSNSGDPNYPWPKQQQRRTQISRKLLQCFFWKYYNEETEYEYKCSIPKEAKIRNHYYTATCGFWSKFSK